MISLIKYTFYYFIGFIYNTKMNTLIDEIFKNINKKNFAYIDMYYFYINIGPKLEELINVIIYETNINNDDREDFIEEIFRKDFEYRLSTKFKPINYVILGKLSDLVYDIYQIMDSYFNKMKFHDYIDNS